MKGQSRETDAAKSAPFDLENVEKWLICHSDTEQLPM
jgi:hypothetical protein